MSLKSRGVSPIGKSNCRRAGIIVVVHQDDLRPHDLALRRRPLGGPCQAPDGLRVVGVETAFWPPTLQQIGEVALRQAQWGVERHGLDLLFGTRPVNGAVEGQFAEDRQVAAGVQVLQPLPGSGRRVEHRSGVAAAVLGNERAQQGQPQAEEFGEDLTFDPVDAFVLGSFDQSKQGVERSAGLQDQGFGRRKHAEPPCKGDEQLHSACPSAGGPFRAWFKPG